MIVFPFSQNHLYIYIYIFFFFLHGRVHHPYHPWSSQIPYVGLLVGLGKDVPPVIQDLILQAGLNRRHELLFQAGRSQLGEVPLNFPINFFC